MTYMQKSLAHSVHPSTCTQNMPRVLSKNIGILSTSRVHITITSAGVIVSSIGPRLSVHNYRPTQVKWCTPTSWSKPAPTAPWHWRQCWRHRREGRTRPETGEERRRRRRAVSMRREGRERMFWECFMIWMPGWAGGVESVWWWRWVGDRDDAR